MARKDAGFMFLNITTITLFLALAGIWYLHRAYTGGSLKTDLDSMKSDGQRLVLSHLPATQEGTGLVSKGADVVKRYINPSSAQNTVPLSTVAPAPVQGAYYGK